MNKSIYKQLVTSHWDWYFLLNLEQYKIKQMIKSFSKAKHYVGWERDVRDMKLCVTLIDIICENNRIQIKSWSTGFLGFHLMFNNNKVQINRLEYFCKKCNQYLEKTSNM